MKKITTIFKKRPIIFTISAVILVIVIYMVFSAPKNGSTETVVVHSRDFIQKLSVSGTVEAAESADLGFAQSGRIAKVYAHVGDMVKMGSVLAEIENGDLWATLLQKQATLQKEEANLATTQQGTRPEELALTTQKYNDAEDAYVIALHSSYLQTEEAVLTKSDSLFTNGNSVNPTLNIPTDSWNLQRSIEGKRLSLNNKLQEWKNIIASLDVTTGTSSVGVLAKAQSVTTDTLNSAKDLMNDLARVTGTLNPGGPGAYSQVTIDEYRSTINSAAQGLATAAATANNAWTTLNNAQNTLSLEQAGSTKNSINAQAAMVNAAQADVINAQAQFKKTVVVAPFDGIVTMMDAKVGEIVSSNTSEIAMNSVGVFQIKSYVPEVYISNLKVGDMATTTLDAYGPSVFFSLKVVAIDPAETVVNGVSNYKATLQFQSTDTRIRPGMTANIDITTYEIPHALVVPQGVVVSKNGQQFIQIKKDGKIITRAVTLGFASSLGEVVVETGLIDGDVVLLNPVVK